MFCLIPNKIIKNEDTINNFFTDFSFFLVMS